MKRVKAGCILQTLVFLQKDDCGLSPQRQLECNREELEKYKRDLDRHNTRYQIVDTAELPDSSIVVRIRKQLNERTDTGEYFN
ncbi:MAG: hypothetical protein IJC98_07175 [Clostridia bacterium]|nr:hypothetical protein [Clostridia bacterium]